MDKMTTTLKFTEAGAVKAILQDNVRMLEVLAAPFGGYNRRDKVKQFFSKNTDFMLDVGDRRPTMYMHGYSPKKRAMSIPKAIGIAKVTKIDEAGLWMSVTLDDSELSTRTWDSALKGTAKASSGSVNYLARPQDRFDRTPTPGEITVWPIAELSVWDGDADGVPVSDDAIVLPIRALFKECEIELPESFEVGENKDSKEDNKSETGGQIMTKELDIQVAVKAELEARDAAEVKAKEQRDAIRAEVLEEIKAEPKYKGVFNIGGKETEGTDGMTDEELETHNYLWYLRNPLQAPKAMRVLEESEAAEGAALIPTPLLNKIIALRDESSLVSKMGITKYVTNSLTLEIPRENAGMGVFATVAEEGAYAANEPAFSGTTCTVVKKGSMITATEELLEDSDLFETYFVALCARKWALTENLELFTKLKATSTAGTHSATFTQPEFDAWMFKMTEPWSDGAQIIMAQATMGTIRGLLVGTPRAYGDFPIFGGKSYPSLMGFPIHLNSNWEAIGAGDTTLTVTMVNPAAIAYVERRGLSIRVDPYGDIANGRIRYFPSYRAVCEVIQVLGNVDYTDHA